MGRALNKGFRGRGQKNHHRYMRPQNYWRRSSLVRPWKVSVARCVGSSHAETGVPCQDQVGYMVSENGVTVFALSDGAGSARYSHYGAYIATHRAMELVSGHFEEAFRCPHGSSEFKRNLVEALQRDLVKAAIVGINLSDEERILNNEPDRSEALLVQCGVRDLACTLLLVAIKGDRYIALHLGDGVVGADCKRFGRRRLMVISGPANGEYANETVFVTSSNAAQEIRIKVGRLSVGSREICGFILMSDGPEVALFNKKTKELAPSCVKLFDAGRCLDSDVMSEQLISTLKNAIQKKTADDCSLVVATTEKTHR